MSFQRNKLRDAIALALVVGATASLSTGAAFAQDAPAPAAAPTSFDTIVVTGTRIQSQTVTASSPVTEINAEEFQYTGATRVDDLVNQYPQMSPYFDSFANNGAQGYPTLDLRGIGPQRTLTLVNGNRLPDGAGLSTDISIIPSFMVKRVDILTGGASAVYGSDAVAGVVNFILDTDFEGVKLSTGISAYRHNNDNEYIQGLLDLRHFPYPTGDTGFDGVSKNIDIAIGGSFADGAGHAMAWLGWRQNEALFQGERDYSSCALTANSAGISGKSCAGSGTAGKPNFLIYNNGADSYYNGAAHLNTDGSWAAGFGERYNFAPINYYQRPDERYTFGASMKYEVNEHFRPYLDTMYIHRTSAIQVAESGTFFGQLLTFTQDPDHPDTTGCNDPLLGSLCDDLGLDANAPIYAYVGKRNIEGGPRHFAQTDSQFRIVAGAEGSINDNWSYNASVLYGATDSDIQGTGDFLNDRIFDALLGCTGLTAGCIPYNVWVPGGVTAAAAAALQGNSLLHTATNLTQFNAYVTGDLPWSFPSADGDPVKLVAGVEWRHNEFEFIADSNSQTGNFAGAGGPSLPLSGDITVSELFLESSIPIIKGDGFMKNFSLDLGFRRSDYDRSGGANTYKLGFNADMGKVRVRGGYNRAIRAPNTGELFATQQIALFTGNDPCAGTAPQFTAAQCANMGVSSSQYGHISTSPAGQYNQLVGGLTTLSPEEATTRTIGFVVQPIDNLTFNLDLYDIKLTNAITTIGANVLLTACGLSGDPFICSKIHRSAGRGDLWIGSNLNTSGYVENLTSNFGTQHYRGVDFGGNFHWDAFGGRMGVNLQGTYLLKVAIAPLPGVTSAFDYDCKGQINDFCQNSKWRHIANWNYTRDRYTVNLRWRYFSKLDYVDAITGAPLAFDRLICAPETNAACLGDGTVHAQSYLDLSASVNLGDSTALTFGVNNIADKEPPLVSGSNAFNGNAPAGYDQAGRYFFANVEFKW